MLTAEQCRNLERAKPEDAQLFVLVYRESPERPSPLGSYDRAQMVAALSCVDRVLVCGMEQADSIAERLRPEVELDVDALQTRDVVRDVLELDRRN